MIPVCQPSLGKKELVYLKNCLATNWISSKGRYIQDFEHRFSRYCGSNYGVTTTSGTTALHLALASLKIGRGDEVIVPAFTMIATVFAVIYTGAKPVLVDADKDTWCIDAAQIEKKLTRRTKAILPVHIYGHPCDMDPILKIAKKYKLFVIEDAAEAHGAEYKGRKVGGLGDIGCFSFYANKIITTGEGGMLVTNSDKIARRAALLKDLAFSPKKRFLHLDVGFNYRMTNLQAALGLAQFEKINTFVSARRRNAKLYSHYLKNIKGLSLPPEKPWAKNVYWMYGILVEKGLGVDRDRLMRELAKKGIETRRFFIPVHKQPVFRKKRLFSGESYPVAESLAKKGMYLPSGSGLRSLEVKFVTDTIRKLVTKAFVLRI